MTKDRREKVIDGVIVVAMVGLVGAILLNYDTRIRDGAGRAQAAELKAEGMQGDLDRVGLDVKEIKDDVNAIRDDIGEIREALAGQPSVVVSRNDRRVLDALERANAQLEQINAAFPAIRDAIREGK